MKALLTDNAGKLWQQEVASPQIGDYECLVKMETCAFCHSTDRHVVDGSGPFKGAMHNPSILGHESIGVVVETGAKVTHLAPGDRMMRVAAIYPGQFQDGIGSAWGGFAEFGKVTDWRAMVDDGHFSKENVPRQMTFMEKIPADISLEKAILMTPLKEIYSSTKRIEPVAGRSFLIAGAGVTACLYGLFLKLAGAAKVTMVARRLEALEFAMSRGSVDEVSLLNEIGQIEGPYDALIETTGNLAVAENIANAALRPDAEIYIYAVYENMGAPDFYAPLSKWRTQRIDPNEPAVHEEVVDLVRSGAIDAAPFITANFRFNEWETAWKSVTEKTSLKTVVHFT